MGATPESHNPDFSDARPVARFVTWIVDRRLMLLAAAAVMILVAYGPANRLQFERTIESTFAEDDPLLVPFQEAKQIFGGSELALAAYVDPDLLTTAGIRRLSELTAKMKTVDGVEATIALDSTPLGEMIVNPSMGEPFLELFEGYLIGADRQTTAVVCLLAPNDGSYDRTATVAQLRGLIEAHDPTGVLTGEPVMVDDAYRYLDEDAALLGRTSTGLLMLVIVISFRSIRWVIVPIAVVNFTLWLTRALLVASGIRLSMVSSMLWAIVTVTGIAMVIHVIVRVREEREAGHLPRRALVIALATLAVPVAWTCCTDAAGFGSLLWAQVGPVQDFGKMMMIGSLLALVSAALILPGLALLGRTDSDPHRAWGEGVLDHGLRTVVAGVDRWPRVVAVVSLSVLVVASIGFRWLDVETQFTGNFRESSPVVEGYDFVEERLGGAGVWDVYVRAPENLTTEYLDRIRRLEQRLRTEVTVTDAEGNTVPGLTKVLSVADAVDAIPLGNLRNSIDMTTLIGMFRQQMPDVMRTLVGTDPDDPDQHYVRIMLRALERQPAGQKTELIEQVTQISREEFDDAQVTGFFILLTKQVESMVQDQWVTFSIASFAIGLMMFFAFRNLPIALVAVVPNVLPIIVITGAMGWLGVRINMGAAMIAAVSVGLSVDSSIHYITEFLQLRRRGYSIYDCIDYAHQRVGRAIVFSTVALVAGFSSLCLSQFVPLIYFGVLVGLSMLGGLVGNLVVLPVLLRMVTRDDPPSDTAHRPHRTADAAATP